MKQTIINKLESLGFVRNGEYYENKDILVCIDRTPYFATNMKDKEVEFMEWKEFMKFYNENK